WGTGPGVIVSTSTTPWCVATSDAFGAARSRPWATASWPPSTGQPEPSAAPAPSATRPDDSASQCGPGCTPARLNCSATALVGWRVADIADAAEVVVSRTVTDLVAGSGIGFEDRGEHRLKGVPGIWRLFAVVHT